MQTSNQPDYLPPDYELNEVELVSQVKDKHTQNFIYVLFVLLFFAAISLWIMQNSVNAYFQQTYHQESPLAKLDQYPAWKIGADIGQGLYAQHDGVKAEIQHNNDYIIQVFNQDYAYTPEYTLYLAEKARLEKIRLAEEAKQRAAEAIKSQFTLTKSDQVFFAGDSLMQGVAPYVQKSLLENYEIKTVNLSRQSTGLSYPSFFNWPQTIKDTIANNPAIKVLVVFLGPNDPWDMPSAAGGKYLRFQSPDWEIEYRSRIADIIQYAQQAKVNVMWLSPPHMRKDSLNQQMMYLNAVIEDEVKKQKGFIIDTRPLLGGKGEVYSDYLHSDGKEIKTRSADGIHFSPEGQKVIAKAISDNLYVVQ